MLIALNFISRSLQQYFFFMRWHFGDGENRLRLQQLFNLAQRFIPVHIYIYTGETKALLGRSIFYPNPP